MSSQLSDLNFLFVLIICIQSANFLQIEKFDQMTQKKNALNKENSLKKETNFKQLDLIQNTLQNFDFRQTQILAHTLFLC